MEQELQDRLKPFSRFLSEEDYQKLLRGLKKELKLRERILFLSRGRIYRRIVLHLFHKEFVIVRLYDSVHCKYILDVDRVSFLYHVRTADRGFIPLVFGNDVSRP